jgi:hypothetical protein
LQKLGEFEAVTWNYVWLHFVGDSTNFFLWVLGRDHRRRRGKKEKKEIKEREE